MAVIRISKISTVGVFYQMFIITNLKGVGEKHQQRQ